MSTSSKKYRSIGVVTFPLVKSGNTPLSNIISILSSLCGDLYLVTGNEAKLDFNVDSAINVNIVAHTGGANPLSRITKYIYTQLRISYQFLKLRSKVHSWFFFSGDELLLPILTAKCLRKEVVIVIGFSGLQVTHARKDALYRVLWLLSKTGYMLSTRIVVYTPRLIEEYKLEKYRKKISIAHHHYIDLDNYTDTMQSKSIEKRNCVGYIGRLDKAKGVSNYLEAMSELLEREPDIHFLIGGDGELRSKVETYLKNERIGYRIEFVGWIPHENIPHYLGRLKLLVLPSYSEGLPNIILEAMSCGIPVLATPVGGIPDVIKDSETGFIMEDNSPQCIARHVIRALHHDNLDEIAENAYNFIKENYTYAAAVESFRPILEDIKQK